MKEKEQKEINPVVNKVINKENKRKIQFLLRYWEEIYRLMGFKHFLLFKEVLPERMEHGCGITSFQGLVEISILLSIPRCVKI